MTAPRVTVFIPTYDREDFVGAAIASVLAQTHLDLECLVIDDGSRDRTREVVRAFTDPRVRLVDNRENRGIPRTRNRGIDEARGEYLAVLDSDDLARPRRIERQVGFLDAHRDVAGVGSWARVIDTAGRPLRLQKCPTTSPGLAFTNMFRCAPRQSTMMFRRAVMARQRYREDCPVSQDLELFGRLARHEGLAAIPEDLVQLRQHDARITVQGHERKNSVRRGIFATRLSELGLEPTPEELDRHLLLGTAKVEQLEGRIDEGTLRWAQDWLEELVRREVAFHGGDAPEVSRAAATVWYRFLKKAAVVLGTDAVLPFADSDLLGQHRNKLQRWRLAWRRLKDGARRAQTGKRLGT
ncbi:MAG: glycosyltransferase family 2 protein [Planctomycetota bacterium]|nr:MAG: glycosyltransferase family 2 protein [Planctomycetota bacterium]